jgi:hypothetical protein
MLDTRKEINMFFSSRTHDSFLKSVMLQNLSKRSKEHHKVISLAFNLNISPVKFAFISPEDTTRISAFVNHLRELGIQVKVVSVGSTPTCSAPLQTNLVTVSLSRFLSIFFKNVCSCVCVFAIFFKIFRRCIQGILYFMIDSS